MNRMAQHGEKKDIEKFMKELGMGNSNSGISSSNIPKDWLED